MFKNILAFIVALFGGAAAAWAVPTNLAVNFESTVWDPPDAADPGDRGKYNSVPLRFRRVRS